MYINIKYKVIFLSNHKTASKSMEEILLKNKLYDYSYNTLNELFPELKKVNSRHLHIGELLHYLKKCKILSPPLFSVFENINQYKIVVFTRNVEDRCKSIYYYQSNLIKRYSPQFPNDLNEAIQKMIKNNNYPFRTFIFREDGTLQHSNFLIFKMEEIKKFCTFIENTFHKKINFFPRKNQSKKKKSVELTMQTKKMIHEYFKFEHRLYF